MAALGLSAEEIAAVDKMADYKVRNGDAFEALIKQKQQGNPKFAFLFDLASPAHAYYQQRYHQLKAMAAAAETPPVPQAAPLAPPTIGGPSQFPIAGGLMQVAPSAQPPTSSQVQQVQQMQQMQQMQMAQMAQMQQVRVMRPPHLSSAQSSRQCAAAPHRGVPTRPFTRPFTRQRRAARD